MANFLIFSMIANVGVFLAPESNFVLCAFTQTILSAVAIRTECENWKPWLDATFDSADVNVLRPGLRLTFCQGAAPPGVLWSLRREKILCAN
jgi:hypothetical protein